MAEFPDGWSACTLGEFIELNYGKGLPAEKRNGSGFPVYGSNGIVGEHEKSLIDGPVIIVGRKGSIGEVHLSQGPCWPIDTTYYIDRLHGTPARFWYYQLKTLGLEKANRASAIPGLNREDAYSKEIVVPPLNEQRRIVAKLDALFDKSRSIREKLDRAPRLLANLQKSILNAAFRGDLTREWRAKNPNVEPASELLKRIRAERRAKWEADLIAKGKDPKKAKYVEPESVDAEGVPELPEGWCWASVDGLSTKVVDGVHKKPNYVNEGVPFLTVKDLTSGPGISFEKCRYVTREDHQEFIQRTKPEKGDILITKDGTLGVVRAIRTDIEFSIFVSLALVKPALEAMSDYLELAFLSPILQDQMTGTGSGLQHIHLTDLRKDMVPLPPLSEQREIVRMVAALLYSVDTLKSKATNIEKRISSINSSLLSKAFSGELVPQDFNDEPARILLDRIRAQKPETKPKRRSSKAASA